MTKAHNFQARIEDAGGGGAFVGIPFDVEAAFGKTRVPVNATIDGEHYRGTLVRTGTPCHILIILKAIRQKIGKGAGDEVEVTVEDDAAPREVAIPEDLRQALEENPEARAVFDTLSHTRQKEFVTAILDAKRDETCKARITRTITTLKTESKNQPAK